MISLCLSVLSLVPQPQSIVETGGFCPTSAVVRCVSDKSLPAEGYRLSVTPEGITVASSDAAGRLYARMTLEQLKGTNGYPCVRIEDRPACRWRGLLIDESRHFFGKEVILQTLELMAFHKLNVLHWHLTDDQGWRIDVPGLPELVKYGSVRPESPKRFAEFQEFGDYRYAAEMNGEPYGPFYYTEKDLREVVARAKELNVTVVPEVDLPGHFRGALAAYPELCCFPENISPRAARSLWGISTDVLCVGNDKSVELIEKILDYVCDVFPSEVIHIGGDECPRLNWEKCSKCQARMKAEGLKTSGDLQTWITRKAIACLERRGRRAMGWDEMLGSGDLPRTVVGQSWRGAADEGVEIELVNGATGAKRGYDMVVNPHRECYYNYKQGLVDDPYPYSGHTVTLETAYAFDPMKGVPQECRAHILGSEACLWGEFITTADELAWKTWPRTCAMAEVLWTGSEKRDFADFSRRLAEHRRRLIAKGVNCAPCGNGPRLSYFTPAPGRTDGRVYYFVPDGIDRTKPAALLIFLHGGEMSSPDWQPENYFGENGYAMPLFKEAPFIVVAPSAPPARDGSRWNREGVAGIVKATIEDAKQRFNIDADRIFLGGHSMGGFGAYHLGQVLADRLAGVWCSAGAWWEADFRAFLGTSVYLQHGALDCSIRPDCAIAPGRPRKHHWCGVSYARAAHELMSKYGVDHVYDEHGGGHSLRCSEAIAATRRFFAWSREQRRNPYARRAAVMTLCGSAHPDLEPMQRSRWLEILETEEGDIEVSRIVLKGPDVVRTDDELKEQTYELAPVFWDGAARLVAENLGGNRFRVEAKGVKSFRIYLSKEMGDLTRPFVIETAGGNRIQVTCESVVPDGDYTASLTVRGL